MRTLRRVLWVVLFVAVFVLVWQFVGGNREPVSVELVFLRLSVPLWVALLGAFAIGALSAGASLVYELAKKSFAARRYKKEMAGLESEIHQLRNLPLQAPDAPGPSRSVLADDVVRPRS